MGLLTLFLLLLVTIGIAGFGIVGSTEARVRALLEEHERRIGTLHDDLLRVERKVETLLRHADLGPREETA